MRQATAAAAALLLVACGGQDGNEQAGAEGKGGGAVALQPGQWETTIQFTELDVPGMPAEVANQMRGMMGQPQTNSACVTPEEAANPAGDLVGGSNENCQYSESTFAGGTIRVRGTCRDPSGGTSQMAMEGSYTPTSMQARITTEQQGAAGTPQAQAMRMTGNLSARRTGECTAAADTPG